MQPSEQSEASSFEAIPLWNAETCNSELEGFKRKPIEVTIVIAAGNGGGPLSSKLMRVLFDVRHRDISDRDFKIKAKTTQVRIRYENAIRWGNSIRTV